MIREHPITGEKTVADLSLPGSAGYPSKYSNEVTEWAQSVAEHRFLAGRELHTPEVRFSRRPLLGRSVNKRYLTSIRDK
jgi:hypothetical protein